MIGTSTWIPSAPLVFTHESSSSGSSASRTRCATRIAWHEAVARFGRVEVEDARSRAGRACRRASTRRSCRCSSSAPSSTTAAGSLTSAKSTSRESPLPRGQVRNCRVGTHDGLALRRLLLRSTRRPSMPCAIALERERPVAQVRDDGLPDRGVVLGEVALRDPVGRKEHTIGTRQADVATADVDLIGHRKRRVQVSSCRRGSRYGPSSCGRTRASKSARSSTGSAASELVVE